MDFDSLVEIQKRHETLLNHIVLPRQLPQTKSLDFHSEELELLKRMVENANYFAGVMPAGTLKMLQSLAKVHRNRTPATVAKEINDLKPGETFAMFIRQQNCGVMIHMPTQSDDVIVATFPGKLNLNEVYGNSSDIEFNYPTQAIRVKHSELLRSNEFAYQFCFLYENEPINSKTQILSKTRDYVTKWLLTVLMNENTKTATDFPIITKKIRDEMLGRTTDHFRRSSFYMTVKAFLQLNLTLELGSDTGKLLYKIMMVHFLYLQCDFFNETTCKTLNIELVTQTMAKLARRIDKLSKMDENMGNGRYKVVKNLVINIARHTIEKTRNKINQQIERIQSTDKEQSQLKPLKELDFEADIYQKVPKLRKHMENRESGVNKTVNSHALQVKSYSRYYMKQANHPAILHFGPLERSEIEENFIISDFENWILYDPRLDKLRFSPSDLRTLCTTYIDRAEVFYKGDQYGVSKSVLVALKMIAMLDKIATTDHPLMLEHNSGINTKIIDHLLLPQAIDMEIAYELERYFKKRNTNANDPSLIGESKVSGQSFSTKFAARNSEMMTLLRDIQAMADRKIMEKNNEWLNAREQVQELRSRISRLECEFDTKEYQSYDSIEKQYKLKQCTVHSSSCQRCHLQRQVINIKISVYERPLPDEQNEKNAVVFELKIPPEVACLRDTLQVFVKYCNGESTVRTNIHGNWVKYSQISHHYRSHSNLVHLGSSRSNVNQSTCLHVDNNFSSFNLPNGFDCTFHASSYKMILSMNDQSIKKQCTLETQSEYKCLQWTLNGTSHTQNQVLTHQSICPSNLSLLEFKNFGSLRADGHRLQWRKLYAMIECEALSFENASVLSLIMQCIWEAEVSGDADEIRESHAEIDCLKFAQALIRLISKFVEKQQNNWVHPLKLLMCSLIAVRVFELNDNETLADQIATLLDQIRTIALDWIEKIQKAIKDMQNRDIFTDNELRTKLIFVTISGALTFFIHSNHKNFNKIFMENKLNGFTAPRIWLQFIVTLNNNIILSNCNTNSLPLNLQMLLRLVRFTGIHIETTVRQMIERDPGDAYKLIKNQWTPSEKAPFTKFYFHSSCRQVLIVEVQVKSMTKFITIDLITGSFLVNNLPICRLPNAISQNVLFKQVFENYVFEAQPDDDNSYSTVQKYNHKSYEFTHTTNGLIIIERGSDGMEIELMPPHILAGEIPELLVNNHSHWWNKHDNQIEFRPKCFIAKNFATADGIEYRLDLIKYHLFHIKTRRSMLDVTSNSYLKIVRQLSRLERQKFIHVLMDEPRIAKVELVRLQLKFKIDCSMHHEQMYDLLSNEFSNMRVSLQQKFGTLFGLNHGLMLESVHNGDSVPIKFLLMPHGEVNTVLTNSHVSVCIDIQSDLRKPQFHTYQFDEFCRQLKPHNSSFSAWFYLAHLHALTSHGEIEPFIGMSGTEQALQILQSGFVWSSAPYDADEIKTLKAIAQLTPKREMRQNMLNISWPSYVRSKSSQDTFIFIVRKLLADSQRLHGLYSDTKLEIIDVNIDLNERDYLRCLHLTPNLRISDEFLSHKKLITSLSTVPKVDFSIDTKRVAVSYHKKSYFKTNPLGLKDFVMKTSNDISGPVLIENVPSLLDHKISIKLDDFWISMYEIVRKQRLNPNQLALIWSLLVHEGHHIASISALQAIHMNPQLFALINPPPGIRKFSLSQGTYDGTVVKNILQALHTKPSEYYSVDFNDARELYDKGIKNNIETLTENVRSQWPCDYVDLGIYPHLHSSINIDMANERINASLLIWNNNRRLEIFLNQIEIVLDNLPTCQHVACPKIDLYFEPTAVNWQKYEIDLNSKVRQSLEMNETIIDEAQSIWLSENIQSTKTSADWWKIYDQIVNPVQFNHLKYAELFPRIVPNSVLPMLISNKTDKRLKMIIGALAKTIATEQRSERIKSYSQQPQLKPTYDREMANKPHVNWTPYEYAEWILFEIEQNLTIRRIQIEIAKRMINPPDIGTKHSTMQLNMGEGKTAVIVPILASVLADGKQACQITVLKSLFATNLKSLRRYLGGLLGRKVYTFPCRRDMPIVDYIDTMHSIYEECKHGKGVILTLPEYRLSFQLKIYESVKKGSVSAARKFLTVHKWINENVRNIFDESDAILQAKYQLIYTVGNQLPIDGGSNRWIVTQALLKRVPIHMNRLYHELGEDKLEYDIDYVTNGHVYGGQRSDDEQPVVDFRKDVFTPCRILDQSIYPLLKEALIEDFLDGRMNIAFPEVSAETKRGLQILLSSTVIDAKTFESTLNGLGVPERHIILILSGLLRFEVLRLVLLKRWRVNYGVNERGTRLMAIPFKAKDVAADMTEFGHTDVAICLTHLSYYYSGLNDDQLYQVFRILATTEDASATYEKWITNIATELIDPSIATYSGINLSDPLQRDQILFPLFRFNMYIIDFFLSNVVFTREAKSFESKLICTAWDLCSHHLMYRVTGFSGTNDTKDILPLPIAQNDLEELESTNENVRQTLLQSENQFYENLPANVSARIILQKLVDCEIPILLDSGALMLELNNKQVAEEWLKMASDIFYDAAVYFDSGDVLQTIDRNDVVAEFDCSVYRENLDRCVVYLDDTHTRGTDLKFPLGSRASVTLSGDITRDKTVQACMRMRQLGKGHSIAFWASFEADLRIREICGLSSNDEITNQNVINFIHENSRTFESENIVHWATAAHNYTKKLAAHKLHENSNNATAIQGLYDKCVDNEYVTLNEMYGDKEDAFLIDISQNKFSTLAKQFGGNENIRHFIQTVDNGVTEKLKLKASDVKRFVHCLDEEQEKELEQEIEEHRQVERPPILDAAAPVFDQQLITLILNGTPCQSFEDLIRKKTISTFSTGLMTTKLFEGYKKVNSNWPNYLLVTNDFIRVLLNPLQSGDHYLRPVWWIARVNDANGYFLLLLSSFECDRLLATFRKSINSTLYMFRPTLSKLHSDLLNETDLQVTGAENTFELNVNDSAQIKMYSGSMYFKNDDEQNAYCNFLGLIPRPRTQELNIAFENGIIKPNGYVPVENREDLAVAKSINQCLFQMNPVNLAIQLIEAHHVTIRKESHASSILERGTKLPIDE